MNARDGDLGRRLARVPARDLPLRRGAVLQFELLPCTTFATESDR